VRGGRARTYYELTIAGVREAEAEAVALAGIARAGRPAPAVSAAERVDMRMRIQRVAELLRFSDEVRESLPRARRRA
jgi:hypothetical protein